MAAAPPVYPQYSPVSGSPTYGQVPPGCRGVVVASGQQRLMGSGRLSQLTGSLDARPLGFVASPAVWDRSPHYADPYYSAPALTSALALGAPRSRSVPRTAGHVNSQQAAGETSSSQPRSYVPSHRSRSMTPRPPARPAQTSYPGVEGIDCRESGSDIPTPGSTGNQLGPVRRPAPQRKRRQERPHAVPAAIHQTSEAVQQMESCLRGLEEENIRLKMSRHQSPGHRTGSRSSIQRLELVLDRLRQDLVHVQQEVTALRSGQSGAARDSVGGGRDSNTQLESASLPVESPVVTWPDVGSPDNDTPTFAGGKFDGFPTLDQEPPPRERCPDDEDCSIM
eukprot:CAMPEP_0204410640 /NCGR_PEP_ID=MMETSP0470-20130426/10859_1 /ASSEMBLY_ACC=CAM_ASM_000385 /TAXON_ID=2969 /ORGANISM="Oxyrrhis marina" /LENGTH=336 /DNA_ID=CAMNT_0051406553 /DNA_START=3 /DNA_END=1013 /DNA_ORIENTATION=+